MNYYNVTLRCGIGIPVQTPATICDSYPATLGKFLYRLVVARADEHLNVAVALDNVRHFLVVHFGKLRVRLYHKAEPKVARTTDRYHLLHFVNGREIAEFVHEKVHRAGERQIPEVKWG